MTCHDCEEIQELGRPYTPVRVGDSNVSVLGCIVHTGQLIDAYHAGVLRHQALEVLREQTEIWADAMHQIGSVNQLAVLLGGSEASFTGKLLHLLDLVGYANQGDPGDVDALQLVYPQIVLAWKAWNGFAAPPTPAELWARVSELAEKEFG